MGKPKQEFKKELNRVQREIDGCVEYNRIILFYDDCEAPILDVTSLENGASEFYFRLSSRKFLVKGDVVEELDLEVEK